MDGISSLIYFLQWYEIFICSVVSVYSLRNRIMSSASIHDFVEQEPELVPHHWNYLWVKIFNAGLAFKMRLNMLHDLNEKFLATLLWMSTVSKHIFIGTSIKYQKERNVCMFIINLEKFSEKATVSLLEVYVNCHLPGLNFSWLREL